MPDDTQACEAAQQDGHVSNFTRTFLISFAHSKQYGATTGEVVHSKASQLQELTSQKNTLA